MWAHHTILWLARLMKRLSVAAESVAQWAHDEAHNLHDIALDQAARSMYQAECNARAAVTAAEWRVYECKTNEQLLRDENEQRIKEINEVTL